MVRDRLDVFHAEVRDGRLVSNEFGLFLFDLGVLIGVVADEHELRIAPTDQVYTSHAPRGDGASGAHHTEYGVAQHPPATLDSTKAGEESK